MNFFLLNLITAEKQKAVLEGNAEFTKNLYTVLSRFPGNVLFSPISVHAVLSLLYQGAKGRTEEAFSKALNVAGQKVAAVGYKDVMTHLNKAKDVTLHMANKIYLQETFELHNSFKSVAKKQFLSEADVLDFRNVQVAAKSINTWVENKTNHKIKEIFNSDDITEDTALVLVNAIYFKGKWLTPFKVENTRTEKFYLNTNDTIDVQMMHIRKKFFLKEDTDLEAQVLKLPYTNTNFSMIVILPKKRNGIAALEEKFANTDLTKITENMTSREVRVSLPKFKVEQTIDLQDPLTQMGLGEIFTKDADLSGLIKSSRPLYVDKAIQKVFIEVNEEGTEAAAATGIGRRLCCYIPPKIFTADHPFVIILAAHHKGSTNVLFHGRISHPQI